MNKSRIKDILISLLMIVFGICLFIWAEKVTNTISILIGIAIVGGGVAVFIIRRRKMLEGL